MSGHAFLPGLFGSVTAVLVPVLAVVSRKWPRLRRPLLAIGGLLVIAVGWALTKSFALTPYGAAPGWAVIACGVLFLFVAGLGWSNFGPVPLDESDTPLKPATSRPLRHFGEAP